MEQKRHIGIGLMILSFVLTTIAGIWLAAQAITLELGQLVQWAVLCFIVIFGLMFAGLRLWLQPSAPEALTDSDVEQQRRLLAALPADASISFSDLAQKAALTPESMADLLRELLRLSLFNGAIDWQNQRIWVMGSEQVRGLRDCIVCHRALPLGDGARICPTCGTLYAQIEA